MSRGVLCLSFRIVVGGRARRIRAVTSGRDMSPGAACFRSLRSSGERAVRGQGPGGARPRSGAVRRP